MSEREYQYENIPACVPHYVLIDDLVDGKVDLTKYRPFVIMYPPSSQGDSFEQMMWKKWEDGENRDYILEIKRLNLGRYKAKTSTGFGEDLQVKYVGLEEIKTS